MYYYYYESMMQVKASKAAIEVYEYGKQSANPSNLSKMNKKSFSHMLFTCAIYEV